MSVEYLTIENVDTLKTRGAVIVSPYPNNRRWAVWSVHSNKFEYIIRLVEQSDITNEIIFSLEREAYHGKYALRNDRDMQYKFVGKNQLSSMLDFVAEMRDEIFRFR